MCTSRRDDAGVLWTMRQSSLSKLPVSVVVQDEQNGTVRDARRSLRLQQAAAISSSVGLGKAAKRWRNSPDIGARCPGRLCRTGGFDSSPYTRCSNTLAAGYREHLHGLQRSCSHRTVNREPKCADLQLCPLLTIVACEISGIGRGYRPRPLFSLDCRQELQGPCQHRRLETFDTVSQPEGGVSEPRAQEIQHSGARSQP
jgi:hypothetical protein